MCRVSLVDPRPVNAGHTHDYDIRGLVLSGIFIVNQGDKPVTYCAGDIFDVPAGRSHSEEIGAEGLDVDQGAVERVVQRLRRRCQRIGLRKHRCGASVIAG